MASDHDPMDENYWRKRIWESINKIKKDKLLTKKQAEDLIKKIREK